MRDNFSTKLQAMMIEAAEKEFGSTARLNEEKVKKLLNSQSFLKDVAMVRSEFNIPELGPEDIENIYFEKDIASVSLWLEENIKSNEQKLKDYQEMINQIFSKYQLPFNFQDWLENFILYRQSLGVPKYPITTGIELMLSESLPSTIRITSQEKRSYIASFRKLLKLPKTGRVPKELLKAYHQFIGYLDRPNNKNKNRRLKNLDISIEVAKKHKNAREVLLDGQHARRYKLNYMDLAGELFPDEEDISFEADAKRAQKLRKIKQRFKEQIELKNQ